ncbi:replication-associated recombination protein A [bacterium]|nr:replication-associated recombination protein A [bacterium]MBU1073548.1 replication-associated recombination protein A [bacterium]MBU1676378.1 replication-associated recombination protein A [bacterium]
MHADLFAKDDPRPRGSESVKDTEAAGSTSTPLAERMRPRSVDEIVGQDDLLGPDRPLRRLIDGDILPSLLLWGPPGCGKTSLARAAARATDAHFLEYSAVQVGSKELKAVMAEAARIRRSLGRRTIIFLDEIHRFNKAQQDALLPWVEKGDVTLIGATTENPSFEINAALLSRTRLFVLQLLREDHLVVIMKRALEDPRGLAGYAPVLTDGALGALAIMSDGDARVALNLLEMAAAAACEGPVNPGSLTLDTDDITRMVHERSIRFDKAGEEFYNLISALHKSVRNSDADAAIYYLARMLEGGADPLYVSRRLVRCASEDVGMADPGALVQAIAARDAVRFVGMPEAALALAQACVYLSLAPKSNALYKAYQAAADEVREGITPPVPFQLRNAPTALMKQLGYGKDYAYAHDEAGGVAAMECLPKRLRGRLFYEPTMRGLEKRYRERLERIREWRKHATRDDDPAGDE